MGSNKIIRYCYKFVICLYKYILKTKYNLHIKLFVIYYLLYHKQYNVLGEFFEQKPLFVRYEAEIALVHGEAFNIQNIYRYGDAIMMLDKKRLQLEIIGNIVIEKIDVGT